MPLQFTLHYSHKTNQINRIIKSLESDLSTRQAVTSSEPLLKAQDKLVVHVLS